MDDEGRVTHEQIIARVSVVGSIVRWLAGGVFVIAAGLVGSCITMHDRVQAHETKIDSHRKEIDALERNDADVGRILMEINGSVRRIEGALGVMPSAKREER